MAGFTVFGSQESVL